MKNNLLPLLKRWHRRIGIISALFVILLSVTGLFLLLTAPLGLDQKTWHGTLISRAYNQSPKSPPTGIPLDESQWVLMIDGLVYVGDAAPIPLTPPLLLAKKDRRFISIANADETLLTLHDGTLVERMPGVDFTGAHPAPLPKAIEKRIIRRYQGRGMPVSRILLDIHTGRFFGKIGAWLMAMASILFLLLSLSGLYMWVRKPKGQRPKSG
ncbi:MAG: hypothetical protein COA84_01095 [Robiginitomaculum sp.]|nr:MAG: hypothetical protein COA84_01095 [Robiginitomaculum sp.]